MTQPARTLLLAQIVHHSTDPASLSSKNKNFRHRCSFCHGQLLAFLRQRVKVQLTARLRQSEINAICAKGSFGVCRNNAFTDPSVIDGHCCRCGSFRPTSVKRVPVLNLPLCHVPIVFSVCTGCFRWLASLAKLFLR